MVKPLELRFKSDLNIHPSISCYCGNVNEKSIKATRANKMYISFCFLILILTYSLKVLLVRHVRHQLIHYRNKTERETLNFMAVICAKKKNKNYR